MTERDPNKHLLLQVVAEHRDALEIDQRSVEFDKLIEYLHFYRMPMWEKFTYYVLKSLGILIGLFIVAGLLFGYLFFR